MPGEGRITKKDVNFFLILCVTSLVLFCDQAAKFIISKTIPPQGSIPIIKNIFHITLVFNKGAAFGIFKNGTSFFIIIGVAALIFMICCLPRFKKEGLLADFAFALLFGGIIGNLIDRLRLGCVVDFLDFRIWPVFNIADAAITAGTALICIQLLRTKKRRLKDRH